MDILNRRDFIKQSSLIAGGLPFMMGQFGEGSPQNPLEVHLFSKHLQFLNYQEMAKIVKEMGFAGVDLTVRPKGHIVPEKVVLELPKACKVIRDSGLKVSMITTVVDDAENPWHQQVLTTAAELSVGYYRMNWLRYPEHASIPSAMIDMRSRLQSLSEFNKNLNLVGCYQNHAGTLVGSSLFELYEIIKNLDTNHLGVQYDIRHATVEGGKSWENGLRLIASRIKTIVLKDFKWGLKNGKWTTINTPMGEGMVDFKKYFGLLKKYGIKVPVSLHLEYDLGGAEHGARQISINREHVYEAMRKDLQFIHQTWDIS